MTRPLALRRIGVVTSALTDLRDAPRQGDEGAPEAWLELDEAVMPALTGLRVGQPLLVLTWLHLANRDELQVHPRNETSRALTGVFATRSAGRPNPVGLHEVRIVEINPPRVRVSGLEAIDGTPLIDLKPVLGPVEAR